MAGDIKNYFNLQNCYPLIEVGVYFQVLNMTRPLKEKGTNRIENCLLLLLNKDVFDVKIFII